MKVTFQCELRSALLSQTDSGKCDPQTAQWLGEEIGSLTAGPEERKVPGTQARAQVGLNLCSAHALFALTLEVPFFFWCFFFFFKKKSMLLVTLYVCLSVLQKCS